MQNNDLFLFDKAVKYKKKKKFWCFSAVKHFVILF